MKTIQHEGEEYVLRSDIESSFKDRISKLSTRATAAEQQATQLQSELDNQSGRLAAIDTLQAQIEDYKGQLEQSNQRYDRHSAMAQYGWNEPDLRDAVEWSYTRAQQGLAKKDQVPLSEWLESIKQDPSTAPSILRPHLQAPEPTETESDSVFQNDSLLLPPKAPAPRAPDINRGAQPAPATHQDILTRATQDIDFYRENRDAIKKAWSTRNR